MKKIVLTSEDVPNKLQLQHSVSRLMKDYGLLIKYRGTKDVEDPKSMLATASFLDMLVRRESRNLKKGEMEGDQYLLSVKEQFKTYLLSLSNEEAQQALDSLKEEINNDDTGLAHF